MIASTTSCKHVNHKPSIKMNSFQGPLTKFIQETNNNSFNNILYLVDFVIENFKQPKFRIGVRQLNLFQSKTL